MSNRVNFLNVVNSLIGSKYHHQGRCVDGIDCIGILAYSIKHLGFSGYTDDTNYTRINKDDRLVKRLNQYFIQLKNKQDYESGDILVFNLNGVPQHIAIYDNGQIVHATQESGRVVKVGFDNRWKDRHSYTFTLKEFV